MSLFSPRQQQRGSVVLVALCFLAVLGIALASYLAVSNQAVKLSNREYQRSISQQLAESGIEQSLWSFSWNNWSSSNTAMIPGSAIRHIFFPATKYNNGVVGSIMLRVDRWDATVWNNFTAYNLASHDIVWYQGVWYQCTSNIAPGTTPPTDIPGNWISAPAPWNASANYQSGNIVLYGGSAYVCALANINTLPTDTHPPAKWNSPIAIGSWDSAINYARDKVVLFGGMSYRCAVANSNNSPPNATFWVGAPAIYSEGIAKPPDNPAGAITTQLRALVAPASLFPNAIAATITVNLTATAGLVDSYNSALGTYPPSVTNLPAQGYSATIAGAYNSGTAVSVSGGTVQGYISAPSKTSSPYPLYANLAGVVTGSSTGTGIDPTRLLRDPYIPQFDISQWDANKGYRPNDIVFYGSDHYVCIATPSSLQNPSSDSTHWKINEPLASADLAAPLDLPRSPQSASSPQSTSIYVFRGSPFNLVNTITITGPVALFVEGDLQVSNPGNIDIAPTTSYPYARAQIQFTGILRVFSTAAITNETLDSKKLILIGSAQSTTSNHVFNSPINFYGTIYLPYTTSALTFTNIGPGDPKIYGAVSAQKITFNSNANFHYDTSLRTTTFPGIDTPFTVTEWRELTDPTEKIVLP